MPGDPYECRQHALSCQQLAETASTPEAREHFYRLAEMWVQLAAELDATATFLKAMRNLGLEKTSSQAVSPQD